MPRFAGPATMMRLPSAPSAKGLDVCFVGVPLDTGTSNRPGARFGPRQIRAESCLLRPYNMATRAAPFDSLRVADIGDVAINTFNLQASIGIIERAYDEILEQDCIPLTLGGDHRPGALALGKAALYTWCYSQSLALPSCKIVTPFSWSISS